MYHLYRPLSKRLFPALGVIGITLAMTTPAHAQVSSNPWGFQAQNRASIAMAMRQVEHNDSSNSVTQLAQPSGSATYTSLTCGSDGKSSASGNSTCIILNNALGNIDVGQDAQGNQNASSNTETSTNDSSNGEHNKTSDVLATLQGDSESNNGTTPQ